MLNAIDPIREHAVRAPSHPALISEDAEGVSRVVSYGELVATMERHAEVLRQGGLGRGDRCALQAPQGALFIELALGILAAEGCLCPIPDDHRGAALDEFVARAYLEAHVERVDGAIRFERIAGNGTLPDATERAFRALSPAYLRFTSGTTSQRKGVVLSHGSIAERLVAANRGLGIAPEDRILWLLPLAHHFVVSILLYLRNGATVLLPSGALAMPTLSFAAREGATLLYASPAHCKRLAADRSEQLLPDLRLAVSTADGLRAEIASAFRERFGHPLVQALGIIEVGLPVINRISAERKPTAIGRPLPDYTIWLRGDDGKPVVERGDPARTGEICIRGPGMLDAYLDPFVTKAQLLEPDGFRTGDQGYLDADGDLHLVGRRANRISMAGMKFFCEEVERVLARHPGVLECRVYGREHPHLGEIPVAEVILKNSADPPDRGELARHCRAVLPAYKVPREFRAVASLARTSSGKVRRGSQRGTR